MRRKYARVISEPYDATADGEEEIAACGYEKKYFLNDGTIGRIDYVLRDIGVIKVSYRQIAPPFDDVLAEHFREYPEVCCEFILPQGVSPEGLRVERVYLYESPEVIDEQMLFLDARGWVVRRAWLGPDGQPISEEYPRYNDAGDIIGRKVYDAITGELRFDADYSEDD